MTSIAFARRTLVPLAIVAITTLSYACHTDEMAGPEEVHGTPAFTISDGASGGNARFFFLPPMVPRPAYSGVSDGTLLPTVSVCEWRTDISQCGNVIAEFTAQGGTGAQTVRYDAAVEQYIVNWDTKVCLSGACTLDPAKTYRLRVFVGRALLGFADVKAASSGSELKNASTGDNVALLNGRTLPVKFRIEQGAVKVVDPETPASIDASGGNVAAADGTAALEIPAGATSSLLAITIEAAVDAPKGTTEGLAPIVELGPDGTQFDKPVTLTLPFDGSQLPIGVPPSALAVFTSDGTGWKEVPGSTVNETEGTVSAPIEHFSTYTLQMRPNVVNGIPQPTTIETGQTTTVQSLSFVYQTNITGQTCYPVRNSFTGYIYSYYCYYHYSTYMYPMTNVAVTWSSAQPQVATTDPGPTYTDNAGIAVSPLIAGVSPGTTQVVAFATGLYSSMPITVIPSSIVRTAADDGAGSLRRVLAQIPAGGTITFADSLSDTASPSGWCRLSESPGCVIKLATPLTIAKNVTIEGPADSTLLSIDGGHTTGSTGVQVIRIQSGTVVLKRLTIAHGYAPSQGGGVFVQSGTVTLEGCRIIGNHASTLNGGLGQGGGLYNLGGNVTLTGTVVSGDSAAAGGALYNYNNGTLNVIGGSRVTDSYASNIGGGILNFGTLRVTASVVEANRAINNGGGVYNFAVAQAVLTNSELVGNSAHTGGAVYNYINGIVTIFGSQLRANTAATNGGGIFNDGSLTLDIASSVSQNSAPNQGGGLFNGVGNAAISGTIVRNRATASGGALGQGGGVYNHSGTVTLVGASVTKDSAAAGGGLYNYNNGTINVNNGSTVAENFASNIGGGILNFGKVNVAAATIRANNATNQGGGIYNFAIAQLTVTESTVQENTSNFGGGLYNYLNGIVSIRSTTFLGNVVAVNGGGIHNDGAMTLDSLSALTKNRAPNQGGGLFNGSGTVTFTGSAISGNRATAAGGALGQGGGVFNHSGTVNLVGALASRDTADAGAALYNYNSGTINVTAGSRITESHATNVGGGLLNFGLVRITSSSVNGNTSVNPGGGLHNFALAQLVLTDVDVRGNSASSGGGLFNYSNGFVSLLGQSSICNNSATTAPANISNLGSLTGTNYSVVGGSLLCAEP